MNRKFNPKERASELIPLPEPRHDGSVSVEKAMSVRRSIRDYAKKSLSLDALSQLLWAAQGITGRFGERTAPSAGALYPLEIYVAAGMVEGIPAGIYKYRPHRHALVAVESGDVRARLASAALGQGCIRDGAVSFVIAAVYERITGKYGKRGLMYVHMEVGHAAQNVHLQAESLGLGSVPVGAFEDHDVKKLMRMQKNEAPLYIISIGKR